jgi:hypothetical protein
VLLEGEQARRYAARYAKAPPRLYSCSTRIACPARGGALRWGRMRAWMLVFPSAEIT